MIERQTERRINELHNELTGLLNSSLDKAIEIGLLLTEKKAELKHGQFGKWIEENLVFSDRTARNYIKLFENKDKLLTAGSITEAYKMLEPVKAETVSDFKKHLPEAGMVTIIRTNNKRHTDFFIYPHQESGYFKRVWFDLDDAPESNVGLNYDKRGVCESVLLQFLERTYKNQRPEIEKVSQKLMESFTKELEALAT